MKMSKKANFVFMSSSLNPYALETYRYELSPERIAQVPVYPPESARLLCVSRKSVLDTEEKAEDCHFFDLPNLVTPGTLMFLNDTRVLPARIKMSARITKPNGTSTFKDIELLYLTSCE
jgi:S-adenosylmethionine:tRNA-ribosyltransferase-isomerase (queuine synthetase)